MSLCDLLSDSEVSVRALDGTHTDQDILSASMYFWSVTNVLMYAQRCCINKVIAFATDPFQVSEFQVSKLRGLPFLTSFRQPESVCFTFSNAVRVNHLRITCICSLANHLHLLHKLHEIKKISFRRYSRKKDCFSVLADPGAINSMKWKRFHFILEVDGRGKGVVNVHLATKYARITCNVYKLNEMKKISFLLCILKKDCFSDRSCSWYDKDFVFAIANHLHLLHKLHEMKKISFLRYSLKKDCFSVLADPWSINSMKWKRFHFILEVDGRGKGVVNVHLTTKYARITCNLYKLNEIKKISFLLCSLKQKCSSVRSCSWHGKDFVFAT